MDRRTFFGAIAAGAVMSTLTINQILNRKSGGPRIPSLFIGHGSPMNAIDTNNYTQNLFKLGQTLPRPDVILMVSAHWMTEGTWVTQMEKPKTIHDFYGFPQALFDVQYPAPGAPEFAPIIQSSAEGFDIHTDRKDWGLDHGTWAVLRHIYPKADIPVLQLSLNMKAPPQYHFELGQQLHKLREKGVMIIGSGNLVHNLRRISWDLNAPAYDWAIEFDEWAKNKLQSRDIKALQSEFLNFEAGKLAHPSLDHYLPMLYSIGAGSGDEEFKFIYEEMQNASISMRSFQIG